MNTNENLHLISDLSLATAISLFCPIRDIDKANPRRAVFVFEKNKNTEDLIKQYWSGDLKVSPLAFFQQLKVIKARIYE